MAIDDVHTASESARRSLARFELATIRLRNVVRTRLGVSDDELTALLHLVEYSQVTQRELLEISTLSRSGVGAMVARLEDAGLLERVPDPADKRVRLLQLSPDGARRMHEAYGGCDDERGRLLEARADEELRALAAIVSQLADATESHAGTVERDSLPVCPGAQPVWRDWGG